VTIRDTSRIGTNQGTPRTPVTPDKEEESRKRLPVVEHWLDFDQMFTPAASFVGYF